MIQEATEADDVILFIDEMHTIIGAGSAEGSIDASSMLKPVLARGAFQIIGATTAEEFRKYLTKDPAFAGCYRGRRESFQPLHPGSLLAR